MAPKMKKQKRTVQLYDDLIIEIMARLPPKSTVRFRSLSNSWSALLTSPHFIGMHLNYVKENKSNDMQRLIFGSTYSLRSMRYEAYEKRASKLDFPQIYPERRRFRFQLLGSCNGLLCLTVLWKTLILWNPSIREFKQLPLSYPLENSVRDIFGFGYDQSNDDYKLIRFCYVADKIELLKAYVNIYSLKFNTWKRIQSFPLSIVFFDRIISGIFVDRILYWNVIGLDSDKITRWILGFDLTSEKFEALTPPNDLNIQDHCTLREIGGYLSFVQNLEGSIEMWKLEKDNMKQCWIKFMTIMSLQTLPCAYNLEPICIMKNGEVLIAYSNNVHSFAEGGKRNRFALYNPVKGTFRRLNVCGIRQWFRAITYTESLVSPKF